MESDPIIWRCISYKSISGGMNWWRNEVAFDDMVSTERLVSYFQTLHERGVDKITVRDMGRLSQEMARGMNPVRAGAQRISKEKLNPKLEEYLEVEDSFM